jgi:NADH dehydrogenase FAD-containing subunit
VALRNRAEKYTAFLRRKSKHPVNILFSRYITVRVSTKPFRPTIVLAGGGHANLYALRHAAELARSGFDVGLVDPPEHLHYSGMTTGVLSGSYEPGENRIGIRHLVERGGGRFAQGRVLEVQHRDRTLLLEDGRNVRYDAVSFCVGSETLGADGTLPVKPVSNLEGVRKRLMAAETGAASRVVIVGGGPAGCEVAANLAGLVRDAGLGVEITLVEAAPRSPAHVLEGLPPHHARAPQRSGG